VREALVGLVDGPFQAVLNVVEAALLLGFGGCLVVLACAHLNSTVFRGIIPGRFWVRPVWIPGQAVAHVRSARA